MNRVAKRLIEIAFEVVVGVAIVGGIFYYAVHFPNSQFQAKWIGMAGSAAIVFGYSLYWTSGVQRPARFWWLWTAFLLLHFILFIALLSLVGRWPLILFIYISLGEFGLIFPVLTRSLVRKDCFSQRK